MQKTDTLRERTELEAARRRPSAVARPRPAAAAKQAAAAVAQQQHVPLQKPIVR